MAFNSFTYLVLFLPIVVGLRSLVRGPLLLLVASLIFYGWARPAHLPLLVGSILFNWAIARALAAAPDERKRLILFAGIGTDVAFLCSFKYVAFFVNGLFALGLPRFAVPSWDFPLGVSFFTLAQIMFLVDTYEGLGGPNRLVEHAAFVAFFPYVSSGPIARGRAIVPQLAGPGGTADDIARGVYLFTLGLFKKVLFADSFARVADLGFAASGQWSTVEAWAFSIAYSLQIYFDFSGYSDMAVGAARMLGIDIPRNFNAPYRSRTVTEFWQRWHMSLSAFITTYLYTPILRSFRRATLTTSSIATLAAMAIAGLWHGPSWTYVVFGLLHGVALVTNQLWKKRVRIKLPTWLAWGLTFAFVNLAFVVFRSPSLGAALDAASRLLPLHVIAGTALLKTVSAIGLVPLLPPLAAGALVAFVGPSSDELAKRFRPSLAQALFTVALLLPSLLYMNSKIVKQFIYFGF